MAGSERRFLENSDGQSDVLPDSAPLICRDPRCSFRHTAGQKACLRTRAGRLMGLVLS